MMSLGERVFIAVEWRLLAMTVKALTHTIIMTANIIQKPTGYPFLSNTNMYLSFGSCSKCLSSLHWIGMRRSGKETFDNGLFI
jgi:tRNA(Arg) A34 adenosine deaminase TadA